MDRAISRRDLLHGMGALTAGELCTPPNQMFALENTGAAGYPPALTGAGQANNRPISVYPDL